MSDLALKKAPNGKYDLDFSRGDLQLSDSLQNAVLLSLGCWSRDENIRDFANLNPEIGGWWGNSLDEVEIGSQIWKLFRQKLNSATAENAVEAAKKALKWMVDDGVAKEIDADAVVDGEWLSLRVTVVKPDSTNEEFRWQVNWENSL